MQSSEVRSTKSSLLLALRRYSSAVSDMEQTVLVPSLLRDVPSDEAWDCENGSQDLYGDYLMLKAIRNTAEGGLLHADDHRSRSGTALSKKLEPLLGTDPETLFHFHLAGLFAVMSELTEKTQSLTDKYMDIIGAPN
ncbi:thyroid hormone-inducible hepatic protein [Salarias fasciatus]|uniref:Thyroid hormone responsive n=1 Tax=Salarias fasciatus TaxID=181472 RepID=A0A672F6E5_SALFA|nr:thyroid hormone-inducible hepatic protein [Salarias fasciatus]